MEELETLESTECPECPGPPPEFRLPPPPRPPFLTEGTFCSESPLAELEDCVAIPVSLFLSRIFNFNRLTQRDLLPASAALIRADRIAPVSLRLLV